MKACGTRKGITPWVSSLLMLAGVALAACGEGGEAPLADAGDAPMDAPTELYSIGAVVQNPEGRTLFVQTVRGLDDDLDNGDALEFAGNSRHWAHGGAVYVGLAEEPTIEKYVPDATGALVLESRVSFLAYGLSRIPAGHIFLDDTKAYLFAEGQYQVVVWNPSTMEIEGSIDLSTLQVDGFDIELWTVSRKGDLVYAPVRYVNFEEGEILHRVSVLQIDAARDEIVAVAHDDRCVGAAEPAITDDGTVYVLADGRSYLAQAYALERMETPPVNCILRILPGETAFDADFHAQVPSITGGRDVVTSLWYIRDGVGFAKMYYPEQLAPGTDTSGFGFWFNPVFKLWRIELGSEIRAEEVQGAPFSMVAFGGVAMDGSLFIGETQDAMTSTVYEIDAESNQATPRFEMQGVMRDLYRLR